MVIDHGRDPASGGCPGACCEILAIGMAGIHHVDVPINRARKEVKAIGIDYFLRGVFQRLRDSDDLSIPDQEHSGVDAF